VNPTDELLRLEAEWMLKFIDYEWQGCKPYSRFARSLPLLLKDYLERTKPHGVGQDATVTVGPSDNFVA